MIKHEPFKIIFQDDSVIVLNKIAKLLIQPSKKGETHTLTSVLAQHLKYPVYPCHRLDRETTGAIIFAKNRHIRDAIMDEFRRHEVKKTYIAFVRGKMKHSQGMLEGYILDTEGNRFGEKPKKAKTSYRVIAATGSFSALELEPITGRTNQLRIQLANIGNPILGERKYAFGRDFKVNFRRLALHAHFLSFYHPITKKILKLYADLPLDMQKFLEQFSIPKTLFV
ncbi:MAG: RluA family pseudouridine synthase [Candidatus Omnitrophica bacterium]|nr:RluA family pseudouridine synthase [Candidatus Omnitrophota bacterium]